MSFQKAMSLNDDIHTFRAFLLNKNTQLEDRLNEEIVRYIFEKILFEYMK